MEKIKNIAHRVEQLKKAPEFQGEDSISNINDILKNLERLTMHQKTVLLVQNAKQLNPRFGSEAQYLADKATSRTFLEVLDDIQLQCEIWIEKGYNIESNEQYIREFILPLRKMYLEL